ncbi:asparagine synthase (glutamine-hydrolyzing) [Wohlfahrtiimonas chitiniclastica]|uniref:asparagine synthase (glutamine-hydrolyzing) n=1 Tax=Wohlfahrtiimonas chitiniclastica TaxID=400946 RepID=UPI0007B698DD|nr:asparagine synthase (glutamine-hydrolyzing) [Wohlfahrtiimonas chitiniclastica]KZX36414.1 asparagine synthetase B [Wohlfahrtiimonas chitiniclastica]
MCGIAGFIDFTKQSNRDVLVSMTDVLSHRGPDDSGYDFYENECANIGLGHRRLSILDLSMHGHQPMAYEHLEIVYNGEVYNFKDIREELKILGYTFNSDSDTEVILKAYYQWGIASIDKLIGMFSIVIYDRQQQKLIIIRDRAGVKPLYYYNKDGLFLFSSELKSFHQHPGFEKIINKEALSLFFQYGYILEPYSIFEKAYKLKAGHYLELDIKKSTFITHKYWDVIDAYNRPKLDISFEEAKLETEKLLKSACEYRMVADVPVGVFLSGGYDSSAVTAILQKDRTEKLKTFSIGFNESKYNEANDAKKIATYLGTDHTEYYCTTKDAQEILPNLSAIWDEPFGDSSSIPTVLVSHLAKKDVAVSLSADGGDEIFGGYGKYTQVLKYQKLITNYPILRKVTSKVMGIIDPDYLIGLNKTYNFKNRYEKVKSLLQAEDEIEMMSVISQHFTSSDISRLLEPTGIIETAFNDKIYLNSNNDVVDKMMAIDYKTYQLDDILVKVDRATMSVGLEGREPFLDHRIIEFVSRLPSSYKIRNGNKKYILKEIVHDYIPKALMDRPKMGFGIPINEWFGDSLKPFIMEYLDHSKVARVGLLNVQEVENIKKQWLENKGYSVSKVWLLLIFMMWYERWM